MQKREIFWIVVGISLALLLLATPLAGAQSLGQLEQLTGQKITPMQKTPAGSIAITKPLVQPTEGMPVPIVKPTASVPTTVPVVVTAKAPGFWSRLKNRLESLFVRRPVTPEVVGAISEKETFAQQSWYARGMDRLKSIVS